MTSGWQEAASQQAEEMSNRFRQLLTTGLGLLRTELGLDLGLEPKRYPSWVFLAVPISFGLLLLLLCVCGSGRGSGNKKRLKEEREHIVSEPKVPVPAKNGKAEDLKKKNKKKPSEKAKQANGRPAELVQEEIITTVKKDNVKQALDVDKKNEKIKKNKKKLKSDSKQVQHSSTVEKKEAEEGNWETKISNREKRQQRKRDKGTDSDVSGFDTTTSIISETYTSVSSHSAVRKTKGVSEMSAVNGTGWNEKPAKLITSQLGEEKWVPAASSGKKKTEPCTWNQEAGDSNGKDWSAPWSERPIFPSLTAWTNVDGRISKPEQRPTSFPTIGLTNTVPAAVSDPVTQPNAPDSQWDVTPESCVDDEWSGLNGSNSGDPSSDWNAPEEVWGNYGEEEPVSAIKPEELDQEAPKVSDNEKDEASAQNSAGSKTKKKKKKKKKQGDESGSPTQDGEGIDIEVDNIQEPSTPAPPQPNKVIPAVVGKTAEVKKKSEEEIRPNTVLSESSVSVINILSEKSPSKVQPQEKSPSVTKQNIVPPPSQGKSEENWESPKQVKKKKKARRET
ncbi:protein LYRIC isoform 2-T2 [Pelodytes ibericus]